MASIRDACRQTFIVTIAAGLLTSCSGLQLPWDDSKAPAPPNVEQRAAELPPPAGGLAAVRLRVAETALKSNDNETAERLYREAHDAEPKAVPPLVGLGEAEYAQHHYEEAATAFRDALARAPNNPAIMEDLAKSLISKGSYGEARTLLEAAVKTAPNASLLNKLGVARDLSGDGPGAQAAYRAALTLDPDNLSMRNNLALSLAISGQHKEAVAEMEKVAADPRAGGRYNGNLAFVYGLAGNLQAAERISGTTENVAESARLRAQYDEIRALAGKGDRAAVLAMLTDKARQQTASASAAASKPASQDASAKPVSTDTPVAATEPSTAPQAEAGASKSELASTTKSEKTTATKTEVAPAAAPTAEPAATAAAEPSPSAKFDAAASVAAKVAETVEPKTESESVTQEAAEPAKPAATVAAAEAKPAPGHAPVAPAAPETLQAQESTKAVSVDAKPASEATPAPVVSAPATAQQPAKDMKVASLEKPETKPASASAKPGTAFGGWQVQLGAYRTSKQADKGWAMLVEKAGDMLHGLYKLERNDAGRSGTSRINYRLRTHALPEKAKAAALCNTLQERKIDCLVVHEVAGVWVASAKTATTKTKVADLAKTAGSMIAHTSATTAGMAAGLVQLSAGTPADSGWRVQLAAYRTLAATERGRKILTSKAAALLPELQALQRVGSSRGNSSIDFRLRTAELPGKAAATDMCKKLQAQGVECLVIRQLPDRWTGAKAG